MNASDVSEMGVLYRTEDGKLGSDQDDVRTLFYKLQISSIGGAAGVAAYSFLDTIVIGQGVDQNGTVACAVFLPFFTIADFIGILCGTD